MILVYEFAFTVCSRVKNPSPSLPSPPLPSMSFQIGKTIFRQKKPHFPSPPPVKWISGTPFSLPSPPLPLLSRSLEHSVKGSLSDYIGRNSKTVSLTWAQRVQICIDIANGINYIHTDMEGKPRIIHRDIKSENILLDENLNAKVADFGLSTFHRMRQQASTIYTQNIAGTLVYVDPEYLKTGKYKRESDIYSFVVLFEVLSGSRAYDPIYIAKNETGLAHIARRCFNEGTLKEMIDPKMIKEDVDCNFTLNRGPNQTSFNAFSEVAYRCLAETQAKRPTMEVVIKELQKALELQFSKIYCVFIGSLQSNFVMPFVF
ncbi:putative protein kinase RLK-Pelle-LRR-I-1 family [Helianthus annuus]|nr:putative protein kinase RLK-Pelle-LRR-I-1 family [Helianthus annuus]